VIAIKAASGNQRAQIASSRKEHFEGPFAGEGRPGEAEAALLCHLGGSGPVRPFSPMKGVVANGDRHHPHFADLDTYC
jgi:hypothetical protein